MIFNKIKLYQINPNTGELKITFLCEDCKKEMETPDYWLFRTSLYKELEPGYHFWCKECYEKRIKNNGI